VSGGGSASRAGELERRYLAAVFADLCRIESPSGRERACADRVRVELEALGLSVDEDGAGDEAGSDCGNLLARLPAARAGEREPDSAGAGTDGDARRSLLLCAHMDTVPLQAPVEPVVRDGFWENANEGILGADNKAAIAVILAAARHICREGAAVDVELLFTVAEEVGLAGARAFDAAGLRSELGYVFDHASPIGEIVTESPTHFRLEVAFRGTAAHAGIRPEEGRSAILAAARAVAAMPHGRLDGETTVNVGTIAGGSAGNVVPEECSLAMEVRAVDPVRAEAVVAEVVDRVHEAANRPDCDVDVDVSVQRSFIGYRLSARSRGVQIAEHALRACGYEPQRISSGGGSDANALLAAGFETVNLANGTERNHEPGERVSELALEQMLDVTLALIESAAPGLSDGAER
jgi:tripeptide aminopeptidase